MICQQRDSRFLTPRWSLYVVCRWCSLTVGGWCLFPALVQAQSFAPVVVITAPNQFTLIDPVTLRQRTVTVNGVSLVSVVDVGSLNPTLRTYKIIVQGNDGTQRSYKLSLTPPGTTELPLAERQTDVTVLEDENPVVIPLSHPGGDLEFTCNGRYAVTCGQPSATPVSVVDLQTETEITQLALERGAFQLALGDDDTTILVSQNLSDVDFSNIGIRKLTLGPNGELADTGQVLAVTQLRQIYIAPGSQIGIGVLRFPPRLVSFNLQTMEIIDTVTAPNDNGDSGVCAALNCTGDRIYLRTEAVNPTAHGMVYKYTLDPVTGLLGDAEDLVFPVSFIGVVGDGANPLAVTLDGESLWVSGTNDGMGSASARGVYIYDSTTGELTGTVTDPTFTRVEDIATLACCASEPAPAASITSVITAGPDRDGNQVIDTTIPLKSNSPSEFTFTVTFDGAGAVGATITDTIPNEWELVSAVSDDAGDVIVSAGAGAAQITNFDPLSLLPSDLWSLLTTGSLSRQPLTRPTNYTWQPTNGAGTLTVTVRTRAARRGRFQPSKQGTYPLNAGAAAFGSDGTQLVDGLGEPLIGPRLTVEARKQRR